MTRIIKSAMYLEGYPYCFSGGGAAAGGEAIADPVLAQEAAERQAAAIVAAVRSEAAAIVAAARAEGEAIRVAAHRNAADVEAAAAAAGRAAGEAAGREEAQAAAAGLLAEAEAIRQASWAERDAMFRQMEDEMVQLALAVAEKILGQAIQAPENIASLVRTALGRAGGTGRATVLVEPAVAEELQAQATIPAPAEDRGGPVEMRAAPGLQPGDCQIETDYGVIDAGVGTQLAQITAALLGKGGQNRAE